MPTTDEVHRESGLVTQSELAQSELAQSELAQPRPTAADPDWRRALYRDIESRLADVGFPCVFARNAFKKQLLRFILVEDVDQASGLDHLRDGVLAYLELCAAWDERLDTAYPLVVAFSPGAGGGCSVGEHHAFGWRVLQALHELDPAPWPAGVSSDAHSTSWSMCFNGVPLFCNMSSPAHRRRRSRNLGEHFVLVINPRERFDVVAGDTPRGRRARSTIRDRVARYDGVPHSAQLGSYGTGALEWQQYGLAEETADPASTCPFVFRPRSEVRP